MSETPKEKLSRAREIACRDMSWQLSCVDASAIRYVLSEMDRLQAIAALLQTDLDFEKIKSRYWEHDSDCCGGCSTCLKNWNALRDAEATREAAEKARQA